MIGLGRLVPLNPKGLASQATGLTPEARGALGLLIAWTQVPILQLDRTPSGVERSRHVRVLFESALEHLGDLAGSKRIEAAIASSEEFQLEEEPSGPSVYRLDFLATLLYAVRSYTEDSIENLGWCLQRTEECLDYLGEQAGMADLDDGMDNATLAAIAALMSSSTVARTVLTDLQVHFQPCREIVEQLVASVPT
jgi:hypothetical protein